MAREVDKRKTGKALRRLKRAAERAAELAASGGGPGLTDWEKDFVAGVSERLETYGSAFRDPTKGALDEALSQRQTQVVRALDKKSRPKTKAPEKSDKPDGAATARPAARSTFKRKAPVRSSRSRDINEDIPVEPAAPKVEPPLPPVRGRPALRVIAGGKGGDKPGAKGG